MVRELVLEERTAGAPALALGPLGPSHDLPARLLPGPRAADMTATGRRPATWTAGGSRAPGRVVTRPPGPAGRRSPADAAPSSRAGDSGAGDRAAGRSARARSSTAASRSAWASSRTARGGRSRAAGPGCRPGAAGPARRPPPAASWRRPARPARTRRPGSPRSGHARPRPRSAGRAPARPPRTPPQHARGPAAETGAVLA